MRISKSYFVIIVTGILLTSSLLFASESPLELIDNDFKNQNISLAQKTLYELMTIRDYDKLPEKYKSDTKQYYKSATSILIEARQNYETFSDHEQELIKRYFERPELPDYYDSPEGHIRIHYTTEGSDSVDITDLDPANGIPDYVDLIAEYCDSAYNLLHTKLGYLVPPTDNGLGGDDKYDCYLIATSYAGFTDPESEGPQAWDDYISYMVLHRNFEEGFYPNEDPEGEQIGNMKVTAVHEYFHAVQLGYNYYAERWFMEASSTWIEEICFPEVNDTYNFLDNFYDVPYVALNSRESLHDYGAFIWNRFLDHYIDTLFIREVWEDIIYNPDIYQVLDDNLQENNSSLSEAYNEFALWNYITGARDDGNHYEDALDLMSVDVAFLVHNYPSYNLNPVSSEKPQGLACNYIECDNPGYDGDLEFVFDGKDEINWNVNLMLIEPGYNYNFEQVTLDEFGDGTFLITDIQDYSYFVVCPVNPDWEADTAYYEFSFYPHPLPDYDVEVKDDTSPDQIYSNDTRRVNFWIYNTGVNHELYDLEGSDNLGWTVEPEVPFKVVYYEDSAQIGVDVTASAGFSPGTENKIMLTAICSHDENFSAVDTVTMSVVRHNGDADESGAIDISDAVYLINYVFDPGFPDPQPEIFSGDANCDDIVDVSDAVFLINYVFVPSSPSPPCLVY